MTAQARQRVLVLDFGAQYAQLIARRVREQNVYCEIVRHDLPIQRIRELAPIGLILSGGPASVYEPGAPHCDPKLFDLGIPVLGICYGMQMLCWAKGAPVEPGTTREFGRTPLRIHQQSDLFFGFPSEATVWMSHGDQVRLDANEFEVLASTATCPMAAVRCRSAPLYGMQFHPEVSHTPRGVEMLANFLRRVCKANGDWQIASFLDQQVNAIRKRVGADRVLCGLSGGVDSAVTAALLQRAIGRQLTCIFVDNGLLRQGERAVVESTFRGHFDVDLRVVDARELFLTRLATVTDPQKKREVIGHTFIDVFRSEATKVFGAKFLAQGTLYPDVIESGSSADGPAANIKLHHNVGGLPKDLGFELIEPLRDLFKDEVRRLGEEIGLPEGMVWRHPFPGPGLAVRCLGNLTAERLDALRKADAIFLQELKDNNLYRKVSQAFAVLLPVRSVGVMGDGRTYDEAIALRAVTTEDFMTADWAPLDHAFLSRVSTRIINEVRGVNRVVYDISTKPPATIEWE